MALLAAAVASRASVLIRPAAAAAASIRRMSSSSTSISTLRAEAASLRAKAASCRAKADTLRATSHDGEVIRAIESATQSHEGSLVEEIPSDFPFEINKPDGLTDITLTRSLKGEQIEVLVSMPRLDQDEEEDSSSSDGYTSYSDEDDQGENRPQAHTVPLTVTISKDDGSCLEFACTAYPDKIVIDSLSMKQPQSEVEEEEDATASEDEEHDMIASDEVVEFSELDENMQQVLHKYLEVRGITPLNTKILHEHMISKDRRRYLLWLTKLRQFVKKD